MVLSNCRAPQDHPLASQMSLLVSFQMGLELGPSSNASWREDILDGAILSLMRGKKPAALRALAEHADHLIVSCKMSAASNRQAREWGLWWPTALGNSSGRCAHRERLKIVSG